MNVLIACECSGIVRRAFHKRGHFAVSCDLQVSDEPWRGFNPWHYQGDVFELLERRARPFYETLNRVEWDLIIAHPTCTRLANSGVRWLAERNLWEELRAGAAFYVSLREACLSRASRVAIENPIMHKYARQIVQPGKRHYVQPWRFGDPFFKSTGFELHNLPPLLSTKVLTPPVKGTPEHAAWSAVHRASPGPDRAKDRSRTYPGIADAMADQWGGLV